MTTPTPHGAPELLACPSELLQAAANYLENYADFIRRTCPINLEEHPYVPDLDEAIKDLRAAIQQAAGAVPEGWKLVPIEPYPAQRIVGTAEWMRQIASDDEPETDKTAAVYRAMLAASPSPLGREAGSSDHLVPCAVGGVTQWQPIEIAPKEDRKPLLLWIEHVNAKYAKDPIAEGWAGPTVGAWLDFNGGGWTWNGIMGEVIRWAPITPPRPDAPTSQINPGSAPREDGHG